MSDQSRGGNPVFLGGGEPGALDALYRRFLDDPHAVPREVAKAFAAIASGGSGQDAAGFAWRFWGNRYTWLDPLRAPPEPPPEMATHPLREAYGGTIGWQFMQVADEEQRDWLAARAETPSLPPSGARLAMLALLQRAESLEQALQKRFPSEKRFGLEGAEGFLVLCEALLHRAVSGGVERVVMGGMHRGRLNLLAHFLGKPVVELMAEVAGLPPFPESWGVAADVVYHNGLEAQRSVAGRSVHLSMLPHPSHLSIVAAVALGRARAEQAMVEKGPLRVLPLTMHTDAAFAGQGVVSEMLQLSRLPPFDLGGAIHLVLDNHVGFTTEPFEGRSAPHATDVALASGTPVIHVNGEDIDAVYRVATVAADYRQRFRQDLVVALHAYRRRGHNELDDPRYTQPLTYDRIERRPTVASLYGEHLAAAGFDLSGVEDRGRRYRARLALDADRARRHNGQEPPRLAGAWSGLRIGSLEEMVRPVDTGVAADRLRLFARRITEPPAGFDCHRRVLAFLERRRRNLEEGSGIDWATAEALAIESLLADGFSVRLGGQDSVRGAFTQRHLLIHDQTNGARHGLLGRHAPPGVRLEVFNTPLTEYAVVGFEYGHSVGDPGTLVLWEAQFGDFLNLAQAVVDQFLVCGEDRWLQSSGLVLLLPHGLDGGGADHSTAHPERLLAGCAGANLQVVNATTPAQYFHLLRRQQLRPFRKPLAVLSPKLLLRHRQAVSDLADFEPGSGFRCVIDDPLEGARRVILCSGKIFYDLQAARAERGLQGEVALIRLEQLYPLDEAALTAVFARHHEAELLWCQEEPENMGPFRHLDRPLEALAGRRLGFVGRPAAATPAVGVHRWHEKEQAKVVAAAFDGLEPRAST